MAVHRKLLAYEAEERLERYSEPAAGQRTVEGMGRDVTDGSPLRRRGGRVLDRSRSECTGGHRGERRGANLTDLGSAQQSRIHALRRPPLPC
jgi:hypothetical protein